MKKNIVIILLALCSLPMLGQQTLSFQTDFGLVSKINYQGADVTEKDKFNVHFGMNYTYFVSPKLAVETGIGLSSYTTNVQLPKTYKSTANEIDAFGSGFEFRASVTNYTEEQKLHLVTIPLRLRLESPITKKVGVYASGGVKFMFPVSQKVNVSASNVTTTGFYPNKDLLIENVPAHGFTTQNNVSTTVEDAPYAFSLAVSAELGVKLSVKKYNFYLGGFVDYGVTDIRKNKDTNSSLISYVDADKPIQSNGISTLKSIDKVNLVSVGLQLRVPLYTATKKSKTDKKSK